VAESSRGVIERYARTFDTNDLDAQEALFHDDVVNEYPQSGERVLGKANNRAVAEQYPGSDVAPLSASSSRVVGADDEYVVGPSFNVTHITGSGDEFVLVALVTYPNGETWHMIQFIRLRDGLVWRIQSYFGAPFGPPEWRAAWVEVSGRDS
jgi:SnoaL-like domain